MYALFSGIRLEKCRKLIKKRDSRCPLSREFAVDCVWHQKMNVCPSTRHLQLTNNHYLWKSTLVYKSRWVKILFFLLEMPEKIFFFKELYYPIIPDKFRIWKVEFALGRKINIESFSSALHKKENANMWETWRGQKRKIVYFDFWETSALRAHVLVATILDFCDLSSSSFFFFSLETRWVSWWYLKKKYTWKK